MGRTVRLGPGAEFDMIRDFLAGGDGLPTGVLLGPGDDCAVVDAGRLALTCDASVEDVHFRRAWLAPEEVGWRAGAASLSDLAAVAAAPLALLVTLAVTRDDVASGWALAVARGLREVASGAGAAVIGGDLTRTPGPAFVDVVAIGRVQTAVLRDGARPGDELWVTGELGAAGGAVALLEDGRPPPEGLRRAFARPDPRWREALWLADHAPLHALLDLSDGLAGDAGHMAAASAVRIELIAAWIPVARGLAEAFRGPRPGLELALHAGEDYELLLAVPPGTLAGVVGDFRDAFGIGLTRVGRVGEGEGVWIDDGDGRSARRIGGAFDHFADGATRAATHGEGRT